MVGAMQPTVDGGPALIASPLTPEELQPYFPQLEIIECLGRGGMGVVYKARQKSLNRLVALKLLAPERAGEPRFAARFEREAHALAALSHPNIVGVYDFGQAGGYYFLLMEFVDGMNLRQLLHAKRLTPKEALSIVPPICEALQCAHDHGIVHRDIKPENLLIDKAGTVKIADFGIAMMIGDSEESGGMVQTGGTRGQGTPAYAAPEQQDSAVATDHRADIYSLGVVLYEMLTGERPKETITPPSKCVQVDIRIDEVVLRALEKTPALRFQTAVEFRTQVEAAGSPPVGSPSGRLPKSTQGFLFEPSQFATANGRFFAYRQRGQLILDHQTLVFSRAGVDTVIPLASIRDISIGQYPRSVSPVSCDLISLTYEEGGESRQVLISPMEGWVGLPSSRNAFAAEWHAAIKSAVLAATGRAPGSTPANELRISQGSSWPHLVLILLPALATVLFIVMVVGPVPAGFTRRQMLIGTAIILMLMPLGFHWWIRRKAPVMAQAPAMPKQSPGNGWGMVGSAVGMTGWMVVTTVLSGWRGAGVALTAAIVGAVVAAALVLWKFRDRMSQFMRQMWLIGVGFVATAAFLLGAHGLGLSMLSRWPGGVAVSPLTYVWALALFPLVAGWHWLVNGRMEERGGSADGSSPTGPTLSEGSAGRHSRWQGWDVWVIGLCLTVFGGLWLLKLSEGPLLNRSLFAGAGAGSNVVLPVALATTILLAGAAFLYVLARNIRSAGRTRAESWKRTAGRTLVPAIAVALLLRTFVIHAFVVPNDSMSPEITKGSRILVWKLTSTYAPGDIVAYRHEDKVWVARVTHVGPQMLTLQKNGLPSTEVQLEAVVGNVISVFWRPSPGAAAP
jgi:serine/threonine protein kinase